MSEHVRITRNRREFLTNAFTGFGALAFADILMRSEARAASLSANPLAPKPPEMPDKAKANVVRIVLRDIEAKGKQVKESDPVVFPDWVATGLAGGKSFASSVLFARLPRSSYAPEG